MSFRGFFFYRLTTVVRETVSLKNYCRQEDYNKIKSVDYTSLWKYLVMILKNNRKKIVLYTGTSTIPSLKIPKQKILVGKKKLKMKLF